MAAALRRRVHDGSSLAVEDVARDLGMSTRSLQAALRAEGESFRLVRDGVRRARAEPMLAGPSVGLEAIAAALAFDDVSSLHRSCMRWFGVSPGRLRRLARSARNFAQDA